jgi:hypothetical protein
MGDPLDCGELHRAIAHDGLTVADDSARRILSCNTPMTDSERYSYWGIIQVAFMWRLPWTAEAPEDWWWPLLDHVLRGHRGWDIGVPQLPSAFLPPDVILNAAFTLQSGLGSLLLAEGVTPEVLVTLCGDPRAADRRKPFGAEIAMHLKMRGDLVTLAPRLTPVLLGHGHPALAALGLEMASVQHGGVRP